MTLCDFKDELFATDEDDLLHFVRKRVFHGIPKVFEERQDDYFEFRNRIANKFEVKYHEVLIVGSAKLGFSYYKEKDFDYDSDIDVAIVNNRLFDEFFSRITTFQYNLDNSFTSITNKQSDRYFRFLKYFVKGWMRPDLLPQTFKMDLIKDEWFEFFKSISFGKSEVGNYKVNAGLFKSFENLERYQLIGMQEYKKKLN